MKSAISFFRLYNDFVVQVRFPCSVFYSKLIMQLRSLSLDIFMKKL